MKLLKKAVTPALALVLVLCVFSTSAFAKTWYDEVSGGSYAPIVGEPYVADTFCGVQSLYSLTTAKYQCNELIMRFYKQAYSLDVMAYMNIGLVMLTEGYEFVNPAQPKKGDIIYSPAKFRNNKSDHWAIVKDYSAGKITLFEQNVMWNGKAGTGRKLNFPSDQYYLYTPVAKAGYPDPVLKGAGSEPETTVTETVTETTATTTAATTQPTTEAGTNHKYTSTQPETSVTEKTEAETVKVTEPVTEPSSEAKTRKQETTLPSTTAAPVTARALTTVATTSAPAETSAEETESAYSGVSETETFTEEETFSETETETEPETEQAPQKRSPAAKGVLIGAAAAAVAACGGIAAVIIKKKKET
ncbi:MAG: hypothetical protein IJJ61_10240 [Clostridia bacterium]|nr:hypothetical protein [Clostridia bacterium]